MATKILTAFFSSGGVPVAGLTPTISIYQVGDTASSKIVTGDPVLEIGDGWYSYAFTQYNARQNYVFTFDGGITLSSHERYLVGGNDGYVEDISAEVWDESATQHTATDSTGLLLNQIKADTGSIALNEVTLATLLNTLLKYERNRTRIDTTNAQMIIYDDDGTTPLMTFDLVDFNGMPNIQEVCERIPVI